MISSINSLLSQAIKESNEQQEILFHLAYLSNKPFDQVKEICLSLPYTLSSIFDYYKACGHFPGNKEEV